MNTDKVKNTINSFIGKNVKVKVNVGRNKYEYYEGVITNVYPYLFTISTNGIVKSVTYTDILTKDVQLKLTNT